MIIASAAPVIQCSPCSSYPTWISRPNILNPVPESIQFLVLSSITKYNMINTLTFQHVVKSNRDSRHWLFNPNVAHELRYHNPCIRLSCFAYHFAPTPSPRALYFTYILVAGARRLEYGSIYDHRAKWLSLLGRKLALDYQSDLSLNKQFFTWLMAEIHSTNACCNL